MGVEKIENVLENRLFIKEVFDRIVALAGLAVLWPVLAVVALLIRVRMPDGPVLFKQKRVGQHGRLFDIYKFRTMNLHHGGSSVSVAGEARITPLGAVLRRYKLDELPELWNIFKGDMSLVGPRPDVPGYADCLQGEARRLLNIKPGLTGAATLKYRHEDRLLARQSDPQRYNDEVLFPDKVRINLAYMAHWRPWLDLEILWCTATGQKLKEEWAQ